MIPYNKYPNSKAVWRDVRCFVGYRQPCKICGIEFNSVRQRLYCDKHKDPRSRTAAAMRRAEKEE